MSIRKVTFVAAAMSILATSPAFSNVITGGMSLQQSIVFFFSPGGAQTFQANNFNNKGSQAAEVRMPAGTLSALKVRAILPNAPSGGAFTLTVRKNGVDTAMACTLTAQGACNSAGPVDFANGDRVSFRVDATFTGLTNSSFAFTYSMVFE
jgi:hypothetical protein